MISRISFLIWILAALAPTFGFGNEPTLEVKEIVVENGDRVSLEAGRISVPENRQANTGRTISIPFYRLPSLDSNRGRAIFILAGGPGSSGIKQFSRSEPYRAIKFYRQFADVIVFDQRGAGGSIPNLRCKGRYDGLASSPATHLSFAEAMERIATECRDYWLDRGVDLKAYNTNENAADIDDLREALGYRKITLIGGSYGSHLGLHYIRRYPQRVDRAVFWGIEGPDHTYDVPSQVMQALKRIAAFVESSGVYADRLPEGGLMEALAVAIQRPGEQPIRVELERSEKSVLVSEFAAQMLATRKAGSRDNPHLWPELILAMYEGDYSLAARAELSLKSMGGPNAMKYMMDHASGVSDARRQLILEDPARKILGLMNADLLATEKAWAAETLTASYRRNVDTDIPVLLIHGTWDTSTPIENAREVAAHMENGHLIEVVGGNHGGLYNLYEHWPPAWDMVLGFLTGVSTPLPDKIDLRPPFPKREPQSHVVEAQ